jgi:tetratricopeptide (TPR) repeat protein
MPPIKHSVMTAKEYIKRGNDFYNKGDYDNAIDEYTKAINLDRKNALVYFKRGYTYAKKGDYDNAITDYTITIKLEPKHIYTNYNLGIAYYKNGDYDNAIKWYTKAIKIGELLAELLAEVYNNRGNAYVHKGDYDKAITDYTQAIELDKKFAVAIQNKILLENFLAICDKYDITEQKEKYYPIYNTANDIAELLKVTNPAEQNVAYYTQKNVAEALLFEKSEFRQNSIVTTNDPQEGKTLIEYLFNNDSSMDWEHIRSGYQAFVGCFSFNHNSLNQFRLYGKHEHKEGTGVSLVFKNSFFADGEQVATSVMPRDDIKKQEATDLSHPTLYRCIYIDPDTHNIISLGQRDILSFYASYGKERSQEAKADFAIHQTNINRTLERVADKFEKLEKAIENLPPHDNKWGIVTEILINLRYLVKHCAFKEEQECRIIRVESLANNDKIKMHELVQMYIEAGEVCKYVKKIYFGPCATGIALFRDRLTLDGIQIECEQSRLPFAGV